MKQSPEKGKWASIPIPEGCDLKNVVELDKDYILVTIRVRGYQPDIPHNAFKHLRESLPKNAYLMVHDENVDIHVNRPKEVNLTIEDGAFELNEEGVDKLIEKLEASEGATYNITLKGCTFYQSKDSE